MTVEVDDGFEVILPSEVDAQDTPEPLPPKIRLCACGCGEEVTGTRSLKRGHTMGSGLTTSVWAAEDILGLQSAVFGILIALTIWVEHKRKIPKMEPEEAQAIANPLGRIMARHFPKKLLKHMKPGDVTDSMSIMTAVFAYSMRMSTMPKENGVISANNGYVSDSGVSGLNQYSYRPAEQITQQENGTAH